MSSFHTRDQNDLDQSLQTLIATHGYAVVQDHLRSLALPIGDTVPALPERQADPRYLLSLSPEQRGRILAAAVEDALPLYEADLRKPKADRELTADLETGDLYEDYDAGPTGESTHHV